MVSGEQHHLDNYPDNIGKKQNIPGKRNDMKSQPKPERNKYYINKIFDQIIDRYLSDFLIGLTCF